MSGADRSRFLVAQARFDARVKRMHDLDRVWRVVSFTCYALAMAAFVAICVGWVVSDAHADPTPTAGNCSGRNYRWAGGAAVFETYTDNSDEVGWSASQVYNFVAPLYGPWTYAGFDSGVGPVPDNAMITLNYAGYGGSYATFQLHQTCKPVESIAGLTPVEVPNALLVGMVACLAGLGFMAGQQR